MDAVIELEVADGRVLRLDLPEPGEGDGFLVICTDIAASNEFWVLLERLAAAGRQVMWKFHNALWQNHLNLTDLTQAARQKIFGLKGYGVGVFFDVHPMIRDAVADGRRSLMFIRDPRDVICTMYLNKARKPNIAGLTQGTDEQPAEMSFAEFLASPQAENVKQRYRRFMELRLNNPAVALFRYEQALRGWSGIAADLVAFFNWQIPPDVVAGIAADAPAAGNRMESQFATAAQGRVDFGALIPCEDMDRLENEFTDMLALLGFPPLRKPPFAVAPAGPVPVAQAPSPAGGRRTYIPPRLDIFEPDPVTFSRLRANSAASMHVLGRDVIMEVDATGCRPVIGQRDTGSPTLACFGCSFTYGIAVAAEETFCSRLQCLMPAWRIENHGISGHGTAQNLLSLQRYLRWNKPDRVAFCWIPLHGLRNVVDITWAQNMSRWMPSPPDGRKRIFPRAALDETGALAWQKTMMPRPELAEADWSDFSAAPFYQDMVCFRLFEAAGKLVESHGGKFFVVALQGRFSKVLSGWLAHAGIDAVQTGVSGEQYTCMPDDPHANAAAHAIYADKIATYLAQAQDKETACAPACPSFPCDPAWPIGSPA